MAPKMILECPAEEPCRCPAHSAHMRQFRPDSGLDLRFFRQKYFKTFKLFFSRSAADGKPEAGAGRGSHALYYYSYDQTV